MSTQRDLNYLSILSRKNAELKAKVNSQINAINASSAQLQQGIFVQGNPAVLAKQPTVAQTQGNAMSNTAFSAVFAKAESMKGTPYFFGGSGGKGGIDCSGFVQAAMKAGGVDLPRTADEMYNKTKGSLVCTSYDPSKMQSGDLIFFKGTQGGKGGATHVGIYIKEGKMYQRELDKRRGNCAGCLQVHAQELARSHKALRNDEHAAERASSWHTSANASSACS